MSSLVSIRGLRVEAREPGGPGLHAVVDGASLEIERGAVTCVVGESGAGKTLLLRSVLGIAGAEPGPVAGQVVFRPAAGREFTLDFGDDMVPLRAPLPGFRPGWANYVFQHPMESLDPFRTVLSEVVDSVRTAHPGKSRQELEEKAYYWIEAARLPDPGATGTLHPHELSGGMARRAAIAVALASEPELLVADEPTTGLDWSNRREVVDLLGQLCREAGMSLVLVSHDFQVVRHLADWVAVMRAGEIVEQGPRARFFEPGPGEHPFTRMLQARSASFEAGRLSRAGEEHP